MYFSTPLYPGIDINANQGPQMNAVAIAFIILSFTVLGLRLISRLVTRISAGMDDWLIGVAAASTHTGKDCSRSD